MIGARWTGSNPWVSYAGTAVSIDTARNILTIKGLNSFGIFTGTDVNNPLPVKLLTFSGEPIGNDAILRWESVFEHDAAYFELYASDNGTEFNLLSGRIPAHGNSQIKSGYQFLDRNAFEFTPSRYYQLKIVDIDGSEDWSDKVFLSAKKGTIPVSVYPNPFKQELMISTGNDEETTISIFDVQSRQVFSKTIIPNNGQIKLDTPSELKSGIYFVQIKSGSQLYTVKLIKE
jgi:hypothetical protein